MSGAAAASVSGPTWAALTLAVLSLLIAIASVAISWYLWHKSGPEIIVLVNTATSQGASVPVGFDDVVGVEVRNTGRRPARIREVSLRIWDQAPGRPGGENSRCLTLEPTYGGFPVAVPPTG